MREHELIDLAEALRPDVTALAGPQTAARLDELLDRAKAGQPVHDELFELLTDNAALRERMNECLPVETDSDKAYSYAELPGHGEIVTAIVFVCPRGDYRYPVLEVGEPVPACPAHQLPLIAE